MTEKNKTPRSARRTFGRPIRGPKSPPRSPEHKTKSLTPEHKTKSPTPKPGFRYGGKVKKGKC